ncbi:hypothetical protein HGRIS_011308 [Hohenbuehelia grisea]|uniref:Uncharacterized protein n=1 Tax=Hohenbuehelia grisea TaxID=104357 RepID=A0ABR3JUP7_9AGAR
MSHYTLLSERRFPLPSAERACFPAPTHDISPSWHIPDNRNTTYLPHAAHNIAYHNTWDLQSTVQVSGSSEWIAPVASQRSRPSVQDYAQSLPLGPGYPEPPRRPILSHPPQSSASGMQLQRSPRPRPFDLYNSNESFRSNSTSTDDTRSRTGNTSVADDVGDLTRLSDTSIKAESEEPEDCFVMEFSEGAIGKAALPNVSHDDIADALVRSQAQAPPTQVPLRASQASDEMKQMMHVFHLDPFTMHKGARRGTHRRPMMETGPLQAPPRFFEFQLDIVDPLDMDAHGLRAFSPSFDIGEPQSQSKAEADRQASIPPLTPPPSWDNPFVDQASSNLMQNDFQLRQDPHSPEANAHDGRLDDGSYRTSISSAVAHEESFSQPRAFQFFNVTSQRRSNCSGADAGLSTSPPSWLHHAGDPFNLNPAGDSYTGPPFRDVSGLPATTAMHRHWPVHEARERFTILM